MIVVIAVIVNVETAVIVVTAVNVVIVNGVDVAAVIGVTDPITKETLTIKRSLWVHATVTRVDIAGNSWKSLTANTLKSTVSKTRRKRLININSGSTGREGMDSGTMGGEEGLMEGIEGTEGIMIMEGEEAM